MKLKSSALLFSLFFVSSGIAITIVKTDSTQNVFSEQVATLPSINKPLNVAQLSNEPISDDSIAVSEDDILLVETQKDKNRLKLQTKALTRERDKGLTESLNAQSNLALQQQLAQQGKPMVASKVASNVVALPASSVSLTPQVTVNSVAGNNPAELIAMNDTQLTPEQQLNEKRKALDLAPPIPPGTFGGGNGNGGPGGAAVTTASAN
ncbi:hypothetical protein AADZ86_02895 [Colwelliaceae bacterium BS250]